MLLLEHISTTAVVDHLRVKISPAVVADRLLASIACWRKARKQSFRFPRKKTLGKRKDYTKDYPISISMASLTGKIVLITGSSIGIGRESAFLFSREGCTLILTYCKDEKEAADAAEKCRTLGAPEAFVVRLDVTDDENILGAVKKISEKFDKIDILVNNAGVILWKPFKEQTFDEIQSQCRVNYEGLVKFTLACLPLVKETIINIASGAGKEAYPKLTTYCGTKFAVRGFTQALAQELKDIMVYCVNPGVTATRMTGFEGIHPSKVAEVIVNTAKGAYVLESGDDVDVWDYFDDAD